MYKKFIVIYSIDNELDYYYITCKNFDKAYESYKDTVTKTYAEYYLYSITEVNEYGCNQITSKLVDLISKIDNCKVRLPKLNTLY